MSDETTDYWMNRGAPCNCNECKFKALEVKVAALEAAIKAILGDGK